jgi:hypothetical protein
VLVHVTTDKPTEAYVADMKSKLTAGLKNANQWKKQLCLKKRGWSLHDKMAD